jgi:hemoglobin-like flavoprotein
MQGTHPMSFSLKLDHHAVLRLFENDPEAKLDLQRAVVASVVRQACARDLGPDLADLVRDVAKSLSCDVKSEAIAAVRDEKALSAAMQRISKDAIREALASTRGAASSALGDRLTEVLQERINSVAHGMLHARIADLEAKATEILESRMALKMAQMDKVLQDRLQSLGEAWKAEAAAQIRADVVGRLNQALVA